MTRTTLRDLWAHKRRLISTCIAVLLGVAFMSGTLVLTSTINSVFDDLFAAGTKGTDAVVRGPVLFKSERGGEQRDRLPEDVVTKVRAVPGVAAASPAIASFEFTLLNKKGDPMGGAGPPTIIGSWDTDPTLNPYQVVSGRAPEANGEAVINRAAANDGPFEVGDTLVLVTPEGQQKLKLVGISRFGDADSSGGVISVATTLAQAQTLAGASNKLDQVNARAKAGISPDQLVTQLRAAKVAPGANVITGEALAKEQATDLKDVFGFFSKILLTFAFIALFVGIFIISNTFSILLAQRTKQLALMRALGASRRQVLGSVLLEAGIIGVISALLGFVAGVGLAQAAFVLLRKAGLDLPSTGLTITAGNAAVSILVGLAITAGSAMLPAIRATRVPPIAALQDVATDESDRSRFRAAAGAVAAVIGVVLLLPSFGSDPSTDRLPTIGLGMALVVVAVLWSLFGTAFLALIGIRLPGLEFRNQRVEAAYRKELVYGEDNADRARPPTLSELVTAVRTNYFRLYFNYMYFNVGRIFYLQTDNIFPYIILAPTIVAGMITLGAMNQILNAFGQVRDSFQYLVKSWTTIVDLLSVYKRLRGFEATLHGGELPSLDQDYLAAKTAG